jgi:hypothetical protein
MYTGIIKSNRNSGLFWFNFIGEDDISKVGIIERYNRRT